MKILQQQIEEKCAASNGAVRYLNAYSGRGRYGGECVGIVGERCDCITVLGEVTWTIATAGDLTSAHSQVDTLLNFVVAFDDGGSERHSILYWPNLMPLPGDNN